MLIVGPFHATSVWSDECFCHFPSNRVNQQQSEVCSSEIRTATRRSTQDTGTTAHIISVRQGSALTLKTRTRHTHRHIPQSSWAGRGKNHWGSTRTTLPRVTNTHTHSYFTTLTHLAPLPRHLCLPHMSLVALCSSCVLTGYTQHSSYRHTTLVSPPRGDKTSTHLLPLPKSRTSYFSHGPAHSLPVNPHTDPPTHPAGWVLQHAPEGKGIPGSF